MMANDKEEAARAGEDGSPVWADGGGTSGEEAENGEEIPRAKSSDEHVVEAGSEFLFGQYVRTTQLQQDSGGDGAGSEECGHSEETSGRSEVETTGPGSIEGGCSDTEAVITTNGHSLRSSDIGLEAVPARGDDSSGDSTVSSSTATSSSYDNNTFHSPSASPDYMNLALKQWSVYLGNVLLNFIHKECKTGNNRCDVQQRQQPSAEQPQDHGQLASASTSSATAGYCPCCHYHNQMAQQQQQQQQQLQQPQHNPLPPTPPTQTPSQPQQQQQQTPPLHQGYYNYAANFSPFLSAAAAAAAFASSSNNGDPGNNNRAAVAASFRGRYYGGGGGNCHYVRTPRASWQAFIRPNCFPH